ncbi:MULTISPECIES: DUF4059 family protein [unclassified Streptococcus]|uniref:DUF4059 family protein n=1 Tax=unclassified Streptococcus TaxID=2608887 RepID=UPI0011B62FFE|nr:MULTISPECIES: DUF4059 family protein [unclassified Streptococcus]TWS94381.1 DUF4059 family protein [Streptococcus sp. sy018]TWT10345.1 DUF4059 family protein [Streptococcus sp. sy004]TWT14655.1 DUF4059 family protein [Streptococcus sp. sy010]
MLINIFNFYLQGLLWAIVFTLVVAIIWLLYRVNRKLDPTVKERQAALYDTMMMVLISIPILSFAFMALILMIKA